MMNHDQLLGLLWAPYLADAYSLGAHWIYNTEKIPNQSLDFEQLNDPLMIRLLQHCKKEHRAINSPVII